MKIGVPVLEFPQDLERCSLGGFVVVLLSGSRVVFGGKEKYEDAIRQVMSPKEREGTCLFSCRKQQHKILNESRNTQLTTLHSHPTLNSTTTTTSPPRRNTPR